MRWLFGAAILAVVPMIACSGCGPQKPAGPPVSKFKSVIKEDIKVGTGAEIKTGDLVLLTYEVKLAKDDSLIQTNDPDKSEKDKNPLAFGYGTPGAVIDGMSEGLAGMKVGGERKISVPWQKGYGAVGKDAIGPYEDLVFNVKLLYLVKPEEKDTVVIEDTKPGTGAELTNGTRGEFNYKASYVNGRVFDDTYGRSQTVKFTPGANQVISGLDKGVVGMKVGGKRRITVAPGAGWGASGSQYVPGNQVQIFDIELVRTLPPDAK